MFVAVAYDRTMSTVTASVIAKLNNECGNYLAHLCYSKWHDDMPLPPGSLLFIVQHYIFTQLVRCYHSRQFVRTGVRSFVCLSRNLRLWHLEETVGPGSVYFLHTYACWPDTFASQLSSESSTPLTFILKVKYSNRKYWEVHTWLSHKRRQILQTLLLQTNWKYYMAFRLEYLNLTLDHFKCQSQGHPHCDWEYLANGDR